MKKCLIAVAAVLAAVSAHAVQISWANASASVVYMPVAGASTAFAAGLDQFWGQIVWVDGGSTSANIWGATTTSGVPTYGLGDVRTTHFATAGVLGSAAHQYNPINDNIPKGSEFFIRLYTVYSGESYYLDVYADGAWGSSSFLTTAETNGDANFNFTWKTATAQGFNYGGLLASGDEGGWKVVPEPATMALLGIGIVAVGLRRRRK